MPSRSACDLWDVDVAGSNPVAPDWSSRYLELQALNEELNASNEQLNVANENLNKLNSQLQGKVAELEMQSQVLSSGEVTTLFLDEDLRVRWFTRPSAICFP